MVGLLEEVLEKLSGEEKQIFIKELQRFDEEYKKSCEGKRGVYADLAEAYLGEEVGWMGRREKIVGLIDLALNRGAIEIAQKYLNKAREFLSNPLMSPPASNTCKPHWRGVVKRFNSLVDYYRNRGLRTDPISHELLEGYTIP